MKIGLEKVRILTKLKTIQPGQEQEQEWRARTESLAARDLPYGRALKTCDSSRVVKA